MLPPGLWGMPPDWPLFPAAPFVPALVLAAPLVVVLLFLGAVPLLIAVYQLYWEARRWHDSNV